MTNESSAEHVYVYRIGPLSLSLAVVLAFASAIGGLHLLGKALVTGAWAEVPAVSGGLACLFLAAVLLRWLRKDYISSQAIVLRPDSVQLPMTAGEDGSDFLTLSDALGTRIDGDYNDHGPALIVETTSKPVAYKSMYFDRYEDFEDFCVRLGRALEADDSDRL